MQDNLCNLWTVLSVQSVLIKRITFTTIYRRFISLRYHYRRISIPVKQETEIRARSLKNGPKRKQEKLEFINSEIKGY